MNEQAANPQDQAQGAEKQLMLQRIYLKDLSFEAPNAPAIFQGEWQPQNEMNLNTKVEQLGENAYEVVLTVTVNSKLGDKTAFIVEVQQAAIVGVAGFEAEEMAPLMGAYVPAQLFPFVREVVADLVSKGSFPQLVLQPVNFDALFMHHQQELARQAQEAGATAH